MDHWAHDPWADDAREPAPAPPPPGDAASRPVATAAPAASAAAASPWAAPGSVGKAAEADALWSSPWGAAGDDHYEPKLPSAVVQQDNGGWGGSDPFAAHVPHVDESIGAKKSDGGWAPASSGEEGEVVPAVPSRRDSFQSEVRLQDAKTHRWDDHTSNAVAVVQLDGTFEDSRANEVAEEDDEGLSDDVDSIVIRKPHPIEFLDLSLIDDLLGPRPAPEDTRERHTASAYLLSSIGAKRAWHKLSRRETLRAVNSGQEDDAYVRVSWKVSRIRGDVMDIVSNWRPQTLSIVSGSVSGADDVFRWGAREPDSAAPPKTSVGTALPRRSAVDDRAKEASEEDPVLFSWSSVAADTGNWGTPKDEPAKDVRVETKIPEDVGNPPAEMPDDLKPLPLLQKPSTKPNEDHGPSVTIHSALPLTPKSADADDEWGDMVDSSREIAIESPPITSSPSPSLTKQSPTLSTSGISTDHNAPDDAPPAEDVRRAPIGPPTPTSPLLTDAPQPRSGLSVDPRAQRAAQSSQGPEMPAPFFSDLQPKASAVRSYLIKKATGARRAAPASLADDDGDAPPPVRKPEDGAVTFDSGDEESPLATSEAWHARRGLPVAAAEEVAPADEPRLGDTAAPPLLQARIQAEQGLREEAERVIAGLGSFAYMLQ